MIEFVKGQMDFLLFFYGLTLVMVGVACFAVARRKNRILPWAWMSGFAFLLGANAWLKSFSSPFSDNPLIAAVCGALSIASLTFFAIFGYLGISRARGARLGLYGKLIGLAALVALLLLALVDLDLALRLLAFGGGPLVAAAFYMTASRVDRLARLLLLAGSAIVLAFAATSAVTPELWTFSIDIDKSGSSLWFVGFLILAILCVLINFIAAGGWAYAQTSKEGDAYAWEQIFTFRIALLTAASVVTIAVLGWLATNIVAHRGDEEARNHLLSRTMTAASAVDPEIAKRLTGSPSDAGKDYFRRAKRRIEAIRAANADTRFVYLMGIKGGEVVFLADAEPEDSKDYSSPGQPYKRASSELRSLFANGKPFVEGPMKDDWGVWISGLAPIKDRATGKTVAVLGIDVDAEAWVRAIGVYRSTAILMTLAACALVLSFSLIWQQTKWSALRIAAIQIANEKKLRRITSTLGEGVLVTDSEGRLTFINPEAERLLGWSESEILGKHVREVIGRATSEVDAKSGSARPLIEVIETGMAFRTEDGVFARKDGKALPVAYVSTPLMEGGKVIGSVTAFRDITERKIVEEMIGRMAYYDPLTGLPNRTLFNDRLQVAIARAHRNKEKLSVLFVDLDNFKAINDSLGHVEGDELLKAVATRLKSLVREGDTVARLGGDEFTLLLPGMVRVDDATKVAQKILQGLRPPFLVNGHELNISGSIGITIYPQDGESAEILLTNADIAMYRAKEKGKDNYQVFSPAMNAAAFERLAMENDLRKAIEADEFEVYFQPQVDIFSGQIIGLEALARWRHPELGLVLSNEFIPLAEETGLIVQIGEIILKKHVHVPKSGKRWAYPHQKSPLTSPLSSSCGKIFLVE